MADWHEHKFLADFQPICATNGSMVGVAVAMLANWLALFGVFWVIGKALRLGFGG